ncbi:MAG: 16S rRNA (guanine(527)-N(7))-methyltransferase RsmG [Desulfuromonadaceae bacterium]
MAEIQGQQLLFAQLAALGLDISQVQCERLIWFATELLRWNNRLNLTAIRTMEEVIEKHLVDSLTPLPLLAGEERLLDIGSGGGFPGLPLKIVREGLSLVSVDAVAKKIRFQRQVVRQLNLAECIALAMRIEELPAWEYFSGGFDVVISRAFSSLRDFVTAALPCLAPTGRIIAMKGPEGHNELKAMATELKDWGLQCREVNALQLPKSKAERLLIVLSKD